MEITASLVKELREKTGAGMMDCKKALVETQGDFQKAIEYLRKKGIASASKKAGRAAKEGAVFSLVPAESGSGVLLEVNCETDFVGRTEQFRHFVKDVAQHILEKNPTGVGADSGENSLFSQSYIKDPTKSVELVLQGTISALGENIAIRRFTRYVVDNGGSIHSYIHGEGKVGVLIEFNFKNAALTQNESFKTLAKDIAMHVAAASPQWVRSNEAPMEVINKEKEIAIALLASQGKPAAMLEKIAEGKIKKFLEENCLIHQAFIKDPTKTVEQILKDAATTFGELVTVKRFTRYVLGDGVADTVEGGT